METGRRRRRPSKLSGGAGDAPDKSLAAVSVQEASTPQAPAADIQSKNKAAVTVEVSLSPLALSAIHSLYFDSRPDIVSASALLVGRAAPKKRPQAQLKDFDEPEEDDEEHPAVVELQVTGAHSLTRFLRAGSADVLAAFLNAIRSDFEAGTHGLRALGICTFGNANVRERETTEPYLPEYFYLNHT